MSQANPQPSPEQEPLSLELIEPKNTEEPVAAVEVQPAEVRSIDVPVLRGSVELDVSDEQERDTSHLENQGVSNRYGALKITRVLPFEQKPKGKPALTPAERQEQARQKGVNLNNDGSKDRRSAGHAGRRVEATTSDDEWNLK